MNSQIKTILDWLGTGSINVFGRPFSGKDTQGHILAELFGGELIGGGDILRSHHDPEKIERIMAEGGIIPSDFYLNMVLPYLSQAKFKEKPIILSAVGRSHGEEEAIMKAAADSGHQLMAVILLQLAENEVWRRFDESKSIHDRGERTDDNRKVLENRLKKFNDKTLPVIEFYKHRNLVIEVDGSLSREEVTSEILKKLASRAA